MMEKTLGVGIIGCGNISWAYLTLSKLFKDIEVRAVADINMDAAKARAAEFGVRAHMVKELLKQDDIDIVVNLTVPATHYKVSKQILDVGKHVYSEKPLTLSYKDALALQKYAAKKKLRVCSAPDTFLGASHQQAAKRCGIELLAISKLSFIRARHCSHLHFTSGRKSTAFNNRRKHSRSVAQHK